jgi:hypothetical protein
MLRAWLILRDSFFSHFRPTLCLHSMIGAEHVCGNLKIFELFDELANEWVLACHQIVQRSAEDQLTF